MCCDDVLLVVAVCLDAVVVSWWFVLPELLLWWSDGFSHSWTQASSLPSCFAISFKVAVPGRWWVFGERSHIKAARRPCSGPNLWFLFFPLSLSLCCWGKHEVLIFQMLVVQIKIISICGFDWCLRIVFWHLIHIWDSCDLWCHSAAAPTTLLGLQADPLTGGSVWERNAVWVSRSDIGAGLVHLWLQADRSTTSGWLSCSVAFVGERWGGWRLAVWCSSRLSLLSAFILFFPWVSRELSWMFLWARWLTSSLRCWEEIWQISLSLLFLYQAY